MKHSPIILPVVALFIEREDNHILLVQRRHIGTPFDGLYDLPSGKVDGNETLRQAAAREAFEETGLIIHPDNIEFRHVIHRKFPDKEILSFIFATHIWQGTPYNKEPEKHSSVGWFAIDDLPDNCIPGLKERASKKCSFYSEWGWQTIDR